MTKTPSEPVFKKIVREVVREEVTQQFDLKLGSFKVEVMDALNKIAERMVAEVVKIRDEITTSNDKIAREIETMREENVISSDKIRVVNEMEDKVDELVKIHPQYTHHFASA